jgi:hypothetical protein
MIGVLILREGSRCGIPTGYSHWGCEFHLFVYRTAFPRLSGCPFHSHLRPNTTIRLKRLLRKFRTTHTNCTSLTRSQRRRSRQTCGALYLRTCVHANLLDTARTVPTDDIHDRSAPDRYSAGRESEGSNRESRCHKAFKISAPINERCLRNSMR